MKQTTAGGAGVLGEFAGAELGDPRRSARLEKIVEAVAMKPDAGFPRLMTCSAALEGFDRFLANEQVSAEALLAPHFAATLARLETLDEALVLHDTTAFSFGGEASREGLGPMGKGRPKGFFGHFGLAVSADGRRDPLGVIGVHTWARLEKTPTQKRREGELAYKDTIGLAKESDRWGDLVDAVEQRGGNVTALIHVMDSEADDYALLAKLEGAGKRFVIRMCYDRVLVADEAGTDLGRRTRAFAASREVVCKRTVKLSGGRAVPRASGTNAPSHEVVVKPNSPSLQLRYWCAARITTAPTSRRRFR